MSEAKMTERWSDGGERLIDVALDAEGLEELRYRSIVSNWDKKSSAKIMERFPNHKDQCAIFDLYGMFKYWSMKGAPESHTFSRDGYLFVKKLVEFFEEK